MSKKVKVPQVVDQWIQADTWGTTVASADGALARIDAIMNMSDPPIKLVIGDPREVVGWIKQHPITAIQAIIDGYDIEEGWFKVHLLPIKQGYLKDHMGNVVVSDGRPRVVDSMGQEWVSIFTKETYEWLRENNDWLPPFDENDQRFEKVSD